jgi:hypothetical protein
MIFGSIGRLRVARGAAIQDGDPDAQFRFHLQDIVEAGDLINRCFGQHRFSTESSL